MKGLELSRCYFEKYGEKALREAFPELYQRMAIGLAGQGSECFGFDDELSRDHDWGPSFCIWLTEKDYLKYGWSVRDVYDRLPRWMDGYGPRKETDQGGGRVGVLCTQTWYRNFTGFAAGPQTLREWRRVPESYLAVATNGEIFHDPMGEFSRIRDHLLDYYPEDIRLKKLAARCARMAQSGQYNYPRCAKRQDPVAMQLALSEFIQAAGSAVYLLNRRYMPFYKWIYRGMKDLPILPRACEMFGRLLTERRDSPQEEAEARQQLIERICMLIEGEMERQYLSRGRGLFMQDHCASLLARIEDQDLRESHVLAD